MKHQTFFNALLTILIAAGPLSAAIKQITLHVEPKAIVKGSAQDEGTPVVFVNEPFRVTVSVEGNKDTSQQVTIEGLDQFDVKGHSQSNNVSIINGNLSSKISHEYELIGRSIGKFTLGPATVSKNTKVASQQEVINVIRKPANFKPQAEREAGVDVQVHFEAQKNKLVLGEPNVITLTVKAHGPVLQVAADPPEFPGFITKSLEGDKHSREVIDGKEYQIIKRHYLITPMQEGERVLGPVSVNYTHRVARPRPQHRTSAFFGNLFDDFSGHRVEQQSATSNELSVSVVPMPVTKKSYSGVGLFESFSITADKTTAQAHEPIMLFAEIRGTGNLDQLATPKLNLPEGWKAYESRQNIDEEGITTQGQYGRKFFEFVLQIPQAGTWELPAQTFRFYNMKTEQFDELMSEPIQLTITPDQQIASPIQHTSTSQMPPQDTIEEEPQMSDDIHFIQDEEITSSHQSNALSWWSFLLLCIAPTLVFSRSFINRLRTYLETDKDKLEVHCKKIEKAIKQNDASILYDLFKGLLAEKFKQPVYAMTHDMIGAQLLNDGMKHDKVEEFLEFLNECARFHFIKESRNSFEEKSIIKKSTYWIVFLNQTSKEQS